jgi:iron complex outermembrane receptor protein
MNASNLSVGLRRFAGIARVTTFVRNTSRLLALTSAAFLAVTAPLHAQSSATGTITGRVFNPANGEYVRNAEVSVAGTNLSASTEAGGHYRLGNVPAGAATVLVTYPGAKVLSAEVAVTAGGTVSQDFSLASEDADTVRLETFKVTSEREGNAKALAQQRKSMTVGRSVAADNFGDVTEGNVGEFLKFLPGIELEYVEADTRGPRLGGMDPEYAGVSIDGMKLASADAFVQYGATENGDTGSGSRSFGFEQVSINSIESIEINRVTGADVDADSPAGNINLKTKRAFDRKGRQIAWNVGTVLNSEEFRLGKSIGPSDRESQKAKPNYSLSYSDVFLNNRLGIVASISESNLYAEQYRADHTYNRTPTATDPRPQVLTSINFKDGPKWTQRVAMSLTADFKATPDLTLSLTTTFNAYDGEFHNRTLAFQAAANNTGATTGRQTVSGDGVLSYGTTSASTTASRLVTPGGGNGIKLTNTLTIVPKFEYQWGERLRLDGAFAYSVSKNDYDNLARGTAANAAVNNLQGISFTATRSSPLLADWQITQTGGTDWADPTAYKNPRISDDGRFARNEIYQGELNATYITPFKLPTFLKFGGKVRELGWKSDQLSPIFSWNYIGPGGGATGDWSAYTSPFTFDMGQTGGRFTSISGAGAPRFASRDDIADLFHAHPEYFASAATPANYETALYLNHRDYLETVSAGYGMLNTKIGKWRLQGGVRYELTEKESREYDPLANSAVAAAGFPVTLVNGLPTGGPTTLAGMAYKYTSKPRVTRTGDYHNYFPSLSAKWDITPNLQLDLGWGKAIKRPDIDKINGVFRIDEVAEEIRAPNPNLLPELSEKYAMALGYYFGKSGTNNLQLTLSQTKIKNLARETDFTAEEFGITDPNFANYTFITSNSIGPKVTFRSLELSYSQRLSFLPKFFQGTSVNAAYTRTYASERRKGLTPHTFKTGVQYSYKRVSLNAQAIWLDEAPWTNTVGRFRRQNIKVDLGGSFKLTNQVRLFFSGRNVFQNSHRIFEQIGGNDKVLWRLENYGSNWAFGVRGTF